MKPEIAFFDFDGTITTKDSFIEFIKFYRGSLSFYFGFLILSPVLVLFKLKLIPNWWAKEAVMKYFFGGSNQKEFQKKCNEFGERELSEILRPKALEEIKKHQQNNVRIVLVSASAENWLTYWTQSVGIECIGTKLEVKEDKITGKIIGKNCYGPAKVERIKELVNLNEYQTIYAYGDSSGDTEMLAIAQHSHYRPFRGKEE